MLQWCLTVAPLGNWPVFVESEWDQCISPSSCLLPRWGGQLFMQQAGLHFCWVVWGLIFYEYFIQKVIPPDCGLCGVKLLCDLIAQSLSPHLFSVEADCWKWSCYKWEPSPTSPFLPSVQGNWCPAVVSQHWKPKASVCAVWVAVLLSYKEH